MDEELNFEELESVTAGLDQKGFEAKKTQITNEYHKEQIEELKRMKEKLTENKETKTVKR